MAADTKGHVPLGLASEWVDKVSPRQVYRCPEHGDFDVAVPFECAVPETVQCSKILDDGFFCLKYCSWVPPTVSFIGGPTTGAKPPSLPEE